MQKSIIKLKNLKKGLKNIKICEKTLPCHNWKPVRNCNPFCVPGFT